MIQYNSHGVIDSSELSKEDCKNYLLQNYFTDGKIDNVQITNVTEDLHPDAQSVKVNFCFKIKEINRVYSDAVHMYVCAIDGNKNPICYEFNGENYHVRISEETDNLFNNTLSFTCRGVSDFNLCYVSMKYMELLIKDNESIDDKQPTSQAVNIKQDALEREARQQAEQQEKADEEKRLQADKENAEFKTKFLSNYVCPRCGKVGGWSASDFSIDADGEFEFCAYSCSACDNFIFEHGNRKTFVFKSAPVKVTSVKGKAPWEIQYYSYPCPYCGAYKVRPAKWEDKQFATAFWGVFARKLHCRFKCDNCKEMWN